MVFELGVCVCVRLSMRQRRAQRWFCDSSRGGASYIQMEQNSVLLADLVGISLQMMCNVITLGIEVYNNDS